MNGGGTAGDVTLDFDANWLSLQGYLTISDLTDGSATLRINKLYVNTIDPVYTIDGVEYATYVSDFAGGVRTETSGVIKLDAENKHIIDFENLEKGSDSWLFWQSSNKNVGDLVVILTPGFDGRVWYQKQSGRVVIYGERRGEVSYRFTLPRHDYEDWSNLVSEQPEQ